MKSFLFLSIIFYLLASCSHDRPKGDTEAEILYKEAQQLVEKERFLLAIEKLNIIRSQFPYSYYATHAELLNADVLYNQENYVEAAAAYIMFKDFHPKHPKNAYVNWKIAESFYNQLPSTFDRDLSSGDDAIKYYEYILTNYPNSEYEKDAKARIVYIKKMQEDKEQYVADFYFKTKDYDAAIFRYKSILNNFDNLELRKHSMEKIIMASFFQEKYDECKQYANSYSGFFSPDQKEKIIKIGQQCQDKLVK